MKNYTIKKVSLNYGAIGNFDGRIRDLDGIEDLRLPIEVRAALAINLGTVRPHCEALNKLVSNANNEARKQLKEAGESEALVPNVAERLIHDQIAALVELKLLQVPVPVGDIDANELGKIPLSILEGMSPMLDWTVKKYKIKKIPLNYVAIGNFNDRIRGLDGIEGLSLPIEVWAALAINLGTVRPHCEALNKLVSNANYEARKQLEEAGESEALVPNVAERSIHDEVSKQVEPELLQVPVGDIDADEFGKIPLSILEGMSPMLDYTNGWIDANLH